MSLPSVSNMKGNIKSDENKSKDHTTLMSSVAEVHRVAQANQQRLHLLEMAVANLTSICTALRYDLDPVKVQAESIDMNPPFSRSPSPSLESKDDVLGAQMQQLVEQATALGILKEARSIHSKPSDRESTDENSKASRRPTTKRIQASNNQKRCTTVTQTAVSNIKAKPTAKLSLKSTVKETKTTTISDVYVESIHKRNKEPTTATIPIKSCVKNAQIKNKGSTKSGINTNQRQTRPTAATSPALITSSLQSESETVIESDLKPRRKWSTPKELTLK